MSRDEHRGLSDLIGFVTIFGIILVAASLTLTVGQGQLDQLRENEQIRNAERGVELLGQQFDRIETGQATVQTGQLQLGPGSLEVTERTDTKISVHEESITQPNNYTLDGTGIRYQSGDQVIAYEGGGIFRRTDGAQSAGVATVPAEFICTDSRAFVSVVTLNGSFSIAGGTVTVRSALANSSVLYPTNRTGTVGTSGNAQNVTVRFPGLSGSENGWEFLDESAGWNRTGPNTYTCAGGGNFSAVVRHTVIDVSVSN
jgi:hypothetical protein